MLRRTLFLPAAVLLTAAALTAQQQPPTLTHVGVFQVKPGKGRDYLNLVRKYEQPVLDKLKAEGTVVAWGVDVPVYHRQGGASHSVWWTVPNYAALEKVASARREVQQKMTAAELQEFFGLTEPDKHLDFLFRTSAGKSRAAPAGTLPYTRIILNRVQPGKADEYRQVWEKYFKPVYERLLADGSVLAYSLEQEAQYSMEPEWRWTVVTLPNLAALDKVTAAFDAEDERRSPQERSMLTGQLSSTTVPGTRRDFLLRALIYSER